jgi:hypothetical protein
MGLSPDIEPDQDPSPGPEIEDLQHLSGRQKASALLQPVHPPTVIAKLCSSAFKRNSGRIWRMFADIMQCPLGHNLKQ